MDTKLFLHEFIEVFCNRQRHQALLNHPPLECAVRFTP
jgi:hypothetical protein